MAWGTVSALLAVRPSFRGGDQFGHVPCDLVSCLRLPDRALQDGVEPLQGAGGQLLGKAIEPFVDVVGTQLFELRLTDERDDVLVGSPVAIWRRSSCPPPREIEPSYLPMRIFATGFSVLREPVKPLVVLRRPWASSRRRSSALRERQPSVGDGSSSTTTVRGRPDGPNTGGSCCQVQPVVDTKMIAAASHDPRAGAGHRPVAVSGQAEPPAGTTTTTRPEPTVRQSPQAQATDYSQMRRRLKGSVVRKRDRSA